MVVAEIGNNHEGNLGLAEELVHLAKEAGVDAVKFQTFRTDAFASRSDEVRYQRLKSFELTQPQFSSLSKLARKLGLLFISTPLDLDSARFLEKHVDAYKIASGDNDFIPLIKQVAATGKPVILSGGLADIKDLQSAMRLIKGERAILHCVSAILHLKK